MLKSHESMVENHWELCCMMNHMVNDYVTLDIDLRLLHVIIHQIFLLTRDWSKHVT